MARSSTKKATPTAGIKREAPAKQTPTRQSKRMKATTTKSPYFEADTEDEQSEDNESKASDFESEDVKEEGSESELSEEESSEDAKPKGATKGRVSKTKSTNEQELWKEGKKLAPGTQVIFKKPKARDAGDTPYTDGTIHPNTMLFLRDLKANNDRQWLKREYPMN